MLPMVAGCCWCGRCPHEGACLVGAEAATMLVQRGTVTHGASNRRRFGGTCGLKRLMPQALARAVLQMATWIAGLKKFWGQVADLTGGQQIACPVKQMSSDSSDRATDPRFAT